MHACGENSRLTSLQLCNLVNNAMLDVEEHIVEVRAVQLRQLLQRRKLYLEHEVRLGLEDGDLQKSVEKKV